MTPPNWIALQGSVNARDVGGLPLGDGREVRPGVLIRTAHLQYLTSEDVEHLVRDLGVRRVVDLRSDIEVEATGPGPLHEAPGVTIHHLSLYPDAPDRTVEIAEPESNPLMPWHQDFETGRGPVVNAYLRYLARRPDSIVAALRAIGEPDGATVVHCAAGKDRTGIVVALALSVVGVPLDVITADYAATESQMKAIIDHLAVSGLYTRHIGNLDNIPAPTAELMQEVFSAIIEEHDGVLPYLRLHGWTDADTAALRRRLVP